MPKSLINYLQLMRAPAVFTAISNILAAHLIVTNGNIQWLNLTILMLASAALYLAGMILNDCFDYQEDARERPNRPLPAGRIALKTAWSLGWLLLGSGVILASLVGFQQLTIAIVLSAFIIIYNGYAKQTLIGTTVMGGCRYLNWLLGLSVLPLQSTQFILALPIFIYVAALTLLSIDETSATKKNYLVFSFIIMLLGSFLLLFIQLAITKSTLVGPIVLLGLFMLIANRMLKTYQNFTPAQIQKTIKFLVMGIIPLDALLVLSSNHFLGAVVVLSLLAPSWLLARSIRVT
jgi:4-hydroxybenzoate polyprenyltransferase